MEIVLSNFNQKRYKVSDAIRIVNQKQAAFYWSKGIEPLDIYPSKDFKTNEPIIVYVFSRKESKESGAYDDWCNRKDN